jgi:hypothetical protein
MYVRQIVGALIVTCTLGIARPAIAASYVTFRAPDDPGNGTYPSDINRQGVVSGTYNGGGGGAFLRYPDGTFTEYGVPGANLTYATSINGAGVVAGSYSDGNDHGYVRLPDGTITTFDVPGATSTWVSAINGQGVVTGYGNGTTLGIGFVRTPDGTITTFQVPGETDGTYPMSINVQGEVTGQYCCSTHGWGGFLRRPDGRIKTFDPTDAYNTHPLRIIHSHWIAGWYSDSNDNYHGFLRTSGVITEFNVKRIDDYTQVAAMNRKGTITGNYFDSTHHRGFLRYPGGRKFVTFDVPSSTNTYPAYINTKNQIVGTFDPASGGNVMGFIRTP